MSADYANVDIILGIEVTEGDDKDKDLNPRANKSTRSQEAAPRPDSMFERMRSYINEYDAMRRE